MILWNEKRSKRIFFFFIITSIAFCIPNCLKGQDWDEIIKLTASDAAASDQFGRSVSIFGNIAIIGADRNDDAGGQSGSAYIVEFNGVGWTETQKLVASDAAPGDRFGHSVSISGNHAVVGARA